MTGEKKRGERTKGGTVVSRRTTKGGMLESKRKSNEKHNSESYDRLTVRIAKGNKDVLIAHMEQKIARINDLQNMTDRTAEQSQELKRLESFYQMSDRGIPSVNHLICQLLKAETGIDIDSKP